MEELQTNKKAPLSVFISYAHEDEPLRQRLEAHLSLLRRQGWITDWHDRQILAGEEWGQEIDEHLGGASIILLLVSPDFLASDYCYEIEMQRALEYHKQGEARVIPIIVRPVDWHSAPFGHLQCLPRDGKAVTTWQNPDEAFLAIAQGLRRIIEQQRISTHPLPEMERKNRRALIKQVRTTWIEGLLEHSLHEAARLELHLQERPDALANPWRLQVQELDRPPRSLPAGTSIVQVYDEADGKLLILGEPGAGKTTLLLELARTLLDRAEADEHHRIPVVFHLSSWAEKRPPLSEWLVEELWTKYQIPRKIAQSWMASDQLLPLLDGLDEVTEEARSGCVQTINAYFQQCAEQGPTPLVVCCRNQEYTGLQTRILLHQAVSIQPLTDDQIERYLQSAKGQLEVLQHALQDDPELYELARRPLMLSIFMLAYQGATPEDLPTERTREAQQPQVFAAYVERMLLRRSAQSRYSQEHIQHWLAWLARQMQQHHMTEFYLEQLQLTWLPTQRARQIYALLIGLIYLLPIFLILVLVCVLLIGLPIGLLIGLLIVLVSLLLGIRQGVDIRRAAQREARSREIRPVKTLTWSWGQFRLMLGYHLTATAVFGLVSGLVAWLVSMLNKTLLEVGFLPLSLLSLLSSVWVVFVQLRRRRQIRQAAWSQETRPMAALTWSWEQFRPMLRDWLFIGLGSGLLVGLLFGLGEVSTSLLLLVLLFMLSSMLFFVLPVVPLSGLSSTQIDKEQRRRPNQGIRRSGWNALLSLLFSLPLSVLLGMLLSVLLGKLGFVPSFVLSFVPFIGPSYLLFVVYAHGGRTYLPYYILCFLLWHSGAMPWHYVRFLDYAVERMLLREVGGGYIFMHRLLLDYFASLEKKEP